MIRSCTCFYLVWTASFAAVSPAQTRRPNIILIMADDVGVEAFGCYGGTSYKTPVIDRLAAKGIRFTQCHSQPLCTPSRVKIMTGKSNARNYRAFSVLPPKQRTFAHVLKSAGYATAVVGKWQLLAAKHYPKKIRGTGTRPKAAGFQEWRLWQVEKLGSRYWGPMYETNGRMHQGKQGEYGPDKYVDFMLEFIDKNAKGPFLAYYPMALVHNPFVPTPDSKPGKRKKGPKHFGAMVTYMDKLVGRIVERLEKLGIAENTLLIFTGDNGTNRKIRSMVGDREVRGGKGLTNYRGTHVPLVAYWPGTIEPGSVCDDLIDFSDFFPTLAELAHVEFEEDPKLDGQSFAQQLLGKKGRPRQAIYCYYHPRPIGRPKSQAVRFIRDKRYKLYGDGRLFDLQSDLEEKEPLGEDALATRAKLQRLLEEMPDR